MKRGFTVRMPMPALLTRTSTPPSRSYRPGGVGPVTIAMLLRNTLRAARAADAAASVA